MAPSHAHVGRDVARLLFLALALFSPPLRAAGGAVSVDVRGAVESPAGSRALIELKALLAARLLQEGFAVVPVEREHEVALGVSFRNPGWTITATLPAETLTRELKQGSTLQADDQLEVIQKATELVRRAHLRASAAAAPVLAPPMQPRPPATIRETPAPAAPSPPLEGKLGADLLIRGDHVDPLVHAGGRIALGAGAHWGGHLLVGVSPSSGGGLEILEWQTLAGIGDRRAIARGLSVEAALLGGVLYHRYSFGPEAGYLVDPLGLLVLTARAQLSRRLGLEFRLAPGVSRTQYSHVVLDNVIWVRSRFRIEAGLSVVLQ